MKREMQYDIVIVGGSYAGLAAAMALGRAMRSVLVIDSGKPCNRQTPHSHNFLTNDGKTPKEIASLAKEQLQKYSTVSFLDGEVLAGERKENGFEVAVQSGQRSQSKKLIMATGIKDVMPNIEGFTESWGISVLHCPYCHGYEVRGQKTGILANGDTAFELASLISNWTSDLTLYTNGKPSLTSRLNEKLRKHQIAIMDAEIAQFQHNRGSIENILFKDGSQAPLKALYARLPFVQHSALAQTLGCELTPEGYIKVDGMQRTTVAGLYACGDNSTRIRTVANAVATGTTAGMMVNKELIEEEF